MDAQSVASFVVSRWTLGHTPESIMLQLVCLGRPMRKADVLVIIRRYVDSQTENTTYKGANK